MFFRAKQLFLRYWRRHGQQSRTGFPLHDMSGRMTGYVDLISLSGGRLELHGWSLSDKVSLVAGPHRAETTPAIARPDVSTVNGGAAGVHVGFSLSLPMASGPWLLVCRSGNDNHVYEVAGFGRAATRRAQLRLLPAFFCAATRAAPTDTSTCATTLFRRERPGATAGSKRAHRPEKRSSTTSSSTTHHAKP